MGKLIGNIITGIFLAWLLFTGGLLGLWITKTLFQAVTGW